MIEPYQNISACQLFEIVSYEEIVKLALENLNNKKGEYYELIKEYILNYEKADKKVCERIKRIIIFLQEYTLKYGENMTVKNLHNSLNLLGAKRNNDLYVKLYSICIKYDASVVIKTMTDKNK